VWKIVNKVDNIDNKIMMFEALEEVLFIVKTRSTRLTPKFQDSFGEYWTSNMYFITCRINIKMKGSLFTFNHKNCTISIVCRKNLTQSDHTDCKIITIEGKEIAFLVGTPDCCQRFEIQ
jgi:hypothetical protein